MWIGTVDIILRIGTRGDRSQPIGGTFATNSDAETTRNCPLPARTTFFRRSDQRDPGWDSTDAFESTLMAVRFGGGIPGSRSTADLSGGKSLMMAAQMVSGSIRSYA